MPLAITPLLDSQGPIVAAIRARFSNAMAVYAFGGQVQGTAGPESDLDLAVLVAGYADPLASGCGLSACRRACLKLFCSVRKRL